MLFSTGDEGSKPGLLSGLDFGVNGVEWSAGLVVWWPFTPVVLQPPIYPITLLEEAIVAQISYILL